MKRNAFFRPALLTALVAGLTASGAAQAALQGRDLDGNLSTAEAYYDTVLDITWLADANYAKTSGYVGYGDGTMNWWEANTWAANLVIVDAVNGIVYDNWRLPINKPVNGSSYNNDASFNGSTDHGYNITSPNSEMAYMFYVNLGNSSYYTPAGTVSGCNPCLDNTGPFSNLQPQPYWSGSAHLPLADTVWRFNMTYGSQYAYFKDNDYHAWAVSPGDVGAVPEAQTYALMLAGLGLIGWRARRRG